MKTAIAELASATPLYMSKPHNVPKEDKESHDAHEKRTWREKLHYNEEEYVILPAVAFQHNIQAAAKYLSLKIPEQGQKTYTAKFKAGIMVADDLVTTIKKEDVKPHEIFVNADGVRGSGKRVWKTFPRIPEWSGTVTYYILDEVITEEYFRTHLEAAGKFIGMLSFRPQNGGSYGRFSVESVDWK